MNQTHELTNVTASTETYQRGLWAVTVLGTVAGFFGLTWLSIQRTEIHFALREKREAEQRTIVVERQRDAAIHERLERVRVLNGLLIKANEARVAAERQSSSPPENLNKTGGAVAVENATQKSRPSEPEALGPNAQEITAFIKAHLLRTTAAGDGQFADYSDDVEFHGKPHASVAMIEAERRQVAQKFPIRVIFTDEIKPRLSAKRDPNYVWIADAVIDFRWEYRSRTGAVVRGVTRDIWKVAPTSQGLRILSERSVDPVTGVSKD